MTAQQGVDLLKSLVASDPAATHAFIIDRVPCHANLSGPPTHDPRRPRLGRQQAGRGYVRCPQRLADGRRLA
jgi:hypothetical protein